MNQWKLSEKEKETDRKEKQWRKDQERNGKMMEDRLEAMKKALAQEKESLYGEIQDLKK